MAEGKVGGIEIAPVKIGTVGGLALPETVKNEPKMGAREIFDKIKDGSLKIDKKNVQELWNETRKAAAVLEHAQNHPDKAAFDAIQKAAKGE